MKPNRKPSSETGKAFFVAWGLTLPSPKERVVKSFLKLLSFGEGFGERLLSLREIK
ncbi:MAG: hypothetical protein JKY70_04820 [Mucilaginibacter sp.]|nr:hypothetical protein [Mucilaginibacter sp.]